ncbi:hypothetical protein JMUB7513_27900 [Staphylococcus aureus]
MQRSLVGSEMCIRDSGIIDQNKIRLTDSGTVVSGDYISCLLYTSDAADEEDSVDLGGRRIIKKPTTPYV